MAKGKFERKSGPVKFRWQHVFLALAVILAGVLAAFWKELVVSVAFQVLCSLVCLYLAFHPGWECNRLEQVILTIAALLPWTVFLGLSDRLVLLQKTLFVLVAAGYILIGCLRGKAVSYAAAFPVGVFCFQFFVTWTQLTYVDDAFQFSKLWYLYLVMVAAALIPAVILTRDEEKTVRKISIRLLAPILGLLVAMMLCNNLNYMLDTSDPEIRKAEILEMDSDITGGRSSYHITVDFDGEEVQLRISLGEYLDYEVGQRVSVSRYEGFFDMPYYTIK